MGGSLVGLRPLVALLLWSLLAAASASAQTLPCQAGQPADKCVLASPTSNIPVGVYDIRPRSLEVTNRQFMITGAGEFKVIAKNVVLLPGARLSATGTDGNTTITLEAAGLNGTLGTLDLQTQGNSKAKIDVSGNFGGGTINLKALGNVTVNGPLLANATNLLGFGGPVNITSTTGSITISGDPSEGIKSFGNAQGGGGSITIDAPLGSITVSTQLVPKGGDCSSCEVNLNAGQNITSTAMGVMDMRASGVGDGGFFSASAGGNINLVGNILANGSSDDFDGGTGGDVLISATGSVTMGAVGSGGRIELNGAGQDAAPGSETGSVDGDSGSSDISAGTTITMNGPMFGISKGFGSGDEFSFDALGNITMRGEIDMTGDNFGGDITILSDGRVEVRARLRIQIPIDPINKPSALGGTIDIEACQLQIVSGGGQVISTGPGGSPSGANFLVASTGFTVNGPVIATAENEFSFRTSPPVITVVPTPAPTLIADLNLPCCGVACPSTTTTTSTTTTSSSTSTSTSRPTTTSTSSTTTTSTSTTRPTTTSIGGATTSTTSTSTSRPTTTSTSSTTTSTSTTRPTTTSTSSTTTSTSTTRPTTTSTSSTTTSTSTTRPTTTSTSSTTTSTSTTRPTTTSTSTSTSSTTSTTLVGCPTTPATGCQTGAKITLLVNEKTAGKEQIQIKVDKLVPNVAQAFFGDPVGGTTGYAACIYDQQDTLVATLRVNRAQATCGTKPCWKVLGGAGGYKYNDKALSSDGVLQVLLKAGEAGKGKAQVKGKRNVPKGQTALPIGVAPQLAGDTSATVQIQSSNAGCVTGDITTIQDNTPILFKGKTP